MEENNLTSASAIFLELGFAAEAVVPVGEDVGQRRKRFESQMFYLAGELDKAHGAHGQFGFVEIDNLTVEALSDELELVRYDVRLPIAWPKDRARPDSYRVVLPRHLDDQGLRAFNSKYADTCAHAKYGEDNLWYDFRPVTTAGCELDAEDVVDVDATVVPSPHSTVGRYPEFPRFWDDGEFRMVLVHGTDGATSPDPNDHIAAQYINFKKRLTDAYPDGVVTENETASQIYDDWRFEATVTAYDGSEGKLIVNTMLTGALKWIGSSFDTRFDAMTVDADLLVYGGHSGLSKNIKAFAAKGVVKPQKYQVMMLQGCSTFAYLDRSVADRRIAVNGTELDPNGTKFLDIIATAQPAYAYTNAPSFWTVLGRLSGRDAVTYNDILDDMPQQAIPLVAGEEDNPDTAP